MQKIAKVFSPIKLNLFFAITGIRDDGYHNVYSLNTAVNFGDVLTITINNSTNDKIVGLPQNINVADNTIQRAIESFRKVTGYDHHYDVNIKKSIPVSAGFGGGSSNATATLIALNKLYDNILQEDCMHVLCHDIGADCGFFLNIKPCITTGIGDDVHQLSYDIHDALSHYNLWIIKPQYNSETAQAYREMKTNYQQNYINQQAAEFRCSQLLHAILQHHDILPLYNTFAPMLYKQHNDIKLLHKKLLHDGIQVMFSGSGSGFFCLQPKSKHKYDMTNKLLSYFGRPLWCQETTFLSR